MKRTAVVLMVALIVVLGMSVLAGQQGRGAAAGQGQAAEPAQGRGGQRGAGERGAGPGPGGGGPVVFTNTPIPFTPPPGAVELQYEATAGIVKLPPDVGTFGEVVGVARNSKGDFFIYTRAEKSRLFQFDRTGKFIKELAKGGYFQDFAHVVRVDKEDNIWAVDEGSNMIVKMNPAGEVTMTLGRKWESVEGRPEQPQRGAPQPAGGGRGANFNRQTDVAWNPQGEIFVADGYNNSRVVKFAKDGDLVKSVGGRGTNPLEFNTPHSIAADSKGLIYVADRGNNRIQVLDSDLNFKAEWKGFGAPWAVCITPAPNEYLFTADPNGHIYKLDMNGKIVAWLGKYGKDVGEFMWIHELHCTSENELYVGEIQNWRMQKIMIKPQAQRTTTGAR
jgi:hypothetical protein